jgi:phasin family protein
MINGIDDIQKFGKENVDVALASAGAVSKGCQALASEAADYTKKSFEASSAAFEKLLAAQSLDKAVEVQSEFVRAAYEDYVGQMTKFGELFVGMAKDAYKPYEGFFGRVGK